MIKEDIITLLTDIIDNKKYSNIQMNYYFKIKRYNSKEKAFVNNVINLVLKNQIYIDYLINSCVKNVQKRKIKHLLRISVAQIFFMNSDDKGVIYEAVEIAKNINVHQGKFVKYALHNILDNKEKLDKNLIENNDYKTLLSYPTYIYERIKNDYENEYAEVLKSFKEKSFLSVRVIKSKISIETFLENLKKINTKVLYNVEDVFYLNNANILDTGMYLEGDVIIQDASSYIVSKNLNCKKDDIVLDACAAPGGKTLAIYNLFQDIQKIVSVDIHSHKINILKDLKEKYNLEKMEILEGDVREINLTNMYFNKILLDVPCSGLGVLRKKPEKVYLLTKNELKNLRKLQREIFDKAYTLIGKGGEILYSTCTILKSENTENIRYMLEKYKDLKVVDIHIPENVVYETDDLGGIYISYKNKYLDGFYMIKVRKE